jgi:hypothetical protein
MENLQEFKERARRAHYWTSFDPEKRGEQLIKEFEEILNNDLEKIKDASDSQKTFYVSKFKNLFSSWLNAKSNCFSAMITGPAKFNNRKHEQSNNREASHYNAFNYWREKAQKAILKSLQPEKTNLSELERYKKDLSERLKTQQLMKDCNAIIRKAKGADCTQLLVNAGLSEKNAIELQKPDFCGRIGFASFNTTNNLANIKRIEQRIKHLENLEKLAENVGEQVFKFKGGTVILDYSIDRVQIKHDSKPDRSIIDSLKHNGFHWSPSNAVWQRQITRAAIYATNQITGLNLISK